MALHLVRCAGRVVPGRLRVCGRACLGLNAALSRRRRMDGERVDAAGQLTLKCLINHAVALEPGLTFEGLRHDIDTEMALASGAVPGMADVLVGFIHDLQALRRKSRGQLL